MANIKFSDFVVRTTLPTVDYIVGYQGADNIQIAPTDLLGAYLPLGGGTMTGTTNHGDAVQSRWGDSSDLRIQHDAADSLIDNYTGNLYIRQQADDKDIIFQNDDGAGGIETYLTLDGGDQRIKIPDAKIMQFGGGGDLQIQHDAVNSLIRNYTGDFIFTNYDNDKDIIFQSDDGVGGTTTYMNIDGSAENIQFNKPVAVGGANTTYQLNVHEGDMFVGATVAAGGRGIYFQRTGATNAWSLLQGHNGTNAFELREGADTRMFWENGGDVGIGTTTPTVGLQLGNSVLGETKLAIFNSEGGGEVGLTLQSRTNRAKLRVADNDTSAYVVAEGGISSFGPSASADTTNISVVAGDVGIGTTTPIEKLDVDGAIISTASNVTSSTAGANRAIMDLTSGGARLGHFRGTTAAGSGSVKLYSDSVLGITLDASQNTQFEGNVGLATGQVQLGTLSGGDLKLYWDGADGIIVNKTGDLKILNQANDKAIIFASDDGSGGTETYFYLDGLGGGGQPFTVWPDAAVAAFGSNHDMRLEHTGSSAKIDNYVGDLSITNYTDDGDLSLRCDNGSGGSATYMYLDGGNEAVRFSKDSWHNDNVKALFGTGTDLEIYHDGSNSYITDTGTGALILRSSTSFKIQNGDGSKTILYAEGSGALQIKYNNSTKLTTTNTGTLTDGQMDIAALNTAPASASAAGTLGEIRYTADYIYVCTATDTWKRSALSTW